MEKMTINELPQSTQAFVVSKPMINSNIDDRSEDIPLMDQNDQPLTQAFTTVPTGPSTSVSDPVTVPVITKTIESTSCPTVDLPMNKSHPTVTFQLAPPRFQNPPIVSNTSAIQPQVTSNDVQQMLLTFSPDLPSTNEEQPQPMEAEPEQLQQQQRTTFSMPSSIESTTSTEE